MNDFKRIFEGLDRHDPDTEQSEMPNSQAITDLRKEIDILNRFEGRFTYMLMVLQKIVQK